MFEGFEDHRVPVEVGSIALYAAGNGPALVLLHGFPQTRAAWAQVAQALSQRFRVIVPDLPGYGDSRGPAPSADGSSHGKREMGTAILEALDALGVGRFAVAGHDRGGRVAYRLGLDHAERVAGLAVMDIMTTLDTWEAMDWQAAVSSYHWPLLAQEAGFVERMIGADPAFYLDHLLDRWIAPGHALAPPVLAAYHKAFTKPEVRAAMAADYRAGAGIDVARDRADREAGRRLRCPVLILRGAVYEPRPLTPAWERWGTVAGEHTFGCGHFLAEELPDAVCEALEAHFKGV